MAEMNTKAMYKLSYGLFVCTAVSTLVPSINVVYLTST